MSGTMFGGSAFALDIGVKNDTGAAVSAGDILMVDARADTDDGYLAVKPETAGTEIGPFTMQGVVLAPEGLEIANGDGCIIRVLGVARAKVKTGETVTAGQLGRAEDGTGVLLASTAVSNVGSYNEINYVSKFIILETVTGATATPDAKVLVRGI